MSRINRLDNLSIGADGRPSPRGRALPWSWPEGARVLLSVLAIAGAIGLVLGRRGSPQVAGAGIVTSGLKLDPSTATPAALGVLPHIGPTLAHRIAEARADGPFRSPEDLRARVRGIGPATLAQIEPYLRFDARPGIGPRLDSEAIAIVDAGASSGRPSIRTSRKPPRSKTRKTKRPSVQLAAKTPSVSSP